MARRPSGLWPCQERGERECADRQAQCQDDELLSIDGLCHAVSPPLTPVVSRDSPERAVRFVRMQEGLLLDVRTEALSPAACVSEGRAEA